MIVRWDTSKLEWEVLHYSPNLHDAERWYQKYVLKYPNCRFMLDYNQINLNKFASDLRDLMKKFDMLRHLEDK
jgi:hypothetical protein